MDFEQAKTVLLEGYSRLEMNVSDQGTALHVQCEGNTYVVTEEDILTYAEQYPSFAALAVAPCECGISSVNYREQIVVPIAPSPIAPIGIRFREPTTFRQQGDNRFVEIGVVTQLFRNRLRFHEPFLEQHSARMRRPAAFMVRERDEHRQIDIVEPMPSFLTARVFNISAPTVEQAVKDTSALIEACLFELSYLKGTSVALSEEWPQRESRGRTFRLTEAFPGNDLPLPTAFFNADIVRFYQRGVSSRDPVIQFLSFYHVLEYFFITASDDRLHATLATRLNDPAFSPPQTPFNASSATS